RFANIGFSQRRTVLYLYGWTLSLAALALAMRFVPYSDDDGTLNIGWALVIAAFGLVALAASLYLVLELEILKFRRSREREIQRQVETGEMPALSADEISREVDREVETGGEVQAVSAAGDEQPDVGELLLTLHAELRERAAEGAIRASGIASDVTLTDPDSGTVTDAVQLELDHAETEAVDVYVPYETDTD